MATPPPPLEELAKYPRMTAWFNPLLLVRLLWRVILSDVFGQYADRRLIVAALDTARSEEAPQGQPPRTNEFVRRARQFMPGEPNEYTCTLSPDAEGAVWVDFVADLGDGFDATYAVACLLAQERLKVGERLLPRGQILFMGGDEVYPRATQKTYQRQLRDPYDWAFPDPHPHLIKGPPVYAIPGNHDWYDGLVVFLALFSREQHLHLGGWRSHQRRSYFALQLTETWWIWAQDAQLGDDIDQPQKDYFATIAKGMADNSKIILCGPEPGWLYTNKVGSKSLSVIDYVAWIALNQHRGLTVPLVISGDTHHYSRYEGNDGITQFITSGGGGAFLHPTHQLTPTVDLNRRADGFSWLDGKVNKLALGTKVGTNAEDAVYPSKAESVSLLAGNFKFVFLNPGFALVLGGVYWLLAMIGQLLPWDINWIAPAILILGFWGYTKNQEGGGWRVALVSAVNGLIHAAALLAVACIANDVNSSFVEPAVQPRLWLVVFAAEMIVVGGTVAGFLFGAYLYITSRCCNMNHNDAFSSMRLDKYRNFLRLRLKDGEVTVFPIGLDTIPARESWRKNDKGEGSPPPAYLPSTPIVFHMIEEPVVIGRAPTVTSRTSA